MEYTTVHTPFDVSIGYIRKRLEPVLPRDLCYAISRCPIERPVYGKFFVTHTDLCYTISGHPVERPVYGKFFLTHTVAYIKTTQISYAKPGSVAMLS